MSAKCLIQSNSGIELTVLYKRLTEVIRIVKVIPMSIRHRYYLKNYYKCPNKLCYNLVLVQKIS